ncbi:MAG: response regulator transcription factor, partial [Saprospiraceae bacterium]|nr:response regulator transcription factor [Saprospiraceae bacterium]
MKTSFPNPQRVVIIDDEEPARKILQNLLNTLRPDCQIVGEADSVASGIKLIRQTSPNLVFLDVAMEDGSGFDLLEMFPTMNFKVVFITAFDNFAIKAFRYNALDYLLKPILPRDLVNSVDRASSELEESHALKLKNLTTQASTRQLSKLALPSQDGLLFVRLDQIVRLEADGNYTTLFTIDKERYIVAQPLCDFEELLPESSFFRTHQSHVINFDFIKKLIKKDGGYISM